MAISEILVQHGEAVCGLYMKRCYRGITVGLNLFTVIIFSSSQDNRIYTEMITVNKLQQLLCHFEFLVLVLGQPCPLCDPRLYYYQMREEECNSCPGHVPLTHFVM